MNPHTGGHEQPLPIRKNVVSLGLSNGNRSYVTQVTYADGPGYRVKKFHHNPDASKAMKFSLQAAEGIAHSLSASYQFVYLNDTRVLRTKEQIDAADQARKAAAELNDIFRSFGRSTYRKARGF